MQAHQTAILAAAVVLAIVVTGAAVYWWYQQRQEEEASRILGNAFAAMRGEQAGAPGKPEEAAKLFQEVVKQYSKTGGSEEALIALGNIQHGAGKTDEALASFEQYLTTFPRGRFTLEAGLGKAYAQEAKGDFQGAAQTLSQALDRNKGDPLAGEAYMSLARVYEELKKPDDATRVYGKVVETYPQSRWAQNALQRMSAIKPK
jgi:TolA-binding protein